MQPCQDGAQYTAENMQRDMIQALIEAVRRVVVP